MKSTKVSNLKLWLLVFSIAFLAFTVFGCNEALLIAPPMPDTGDFADFVPEAERIIQAGLADDDPLIRARAIEVVADTRRMRLMPKVHRLLKDDYVPVRFAAALAVGDLEYLLAESEVRQLLRDKDENVRIAADYAIGKLTSASSFELIRSAIASDDQTVKANAGLLLGKVGDKGALKFLYWALRSKDSDAKVRFQAAEAIARLGDERIYPKLFALLISAYADDRVMGIKTMGALGTEQAKDALVTMLDDDVLEVRLAAAEQLGALGDTAGRAQVLEVFTSNLTAGLDKEELERVKVLTALAIGRIGAGSLTKFLPVLVKDESKLVRIAASKAIFQCIDGQMAEG